MRRRSRRKTKEERKREKNFRGRMYGNRKFHGKFILMPRYMQNSKFLILVILDSLILLKSILSLFLSLSLSLLAFLFPCLPSFLFYLSLLSPPPCTTTTLFFNFFFFSLVLFSLVFHLRIVRVDRRIF